MEEHRAERDSMISKADEWLEEQRGILDDAIKLEKAAIEKDLQKEMKAVEGRVIERLKREYKRQMKDNSESIRRYLTLFPERREKIDELMATKTKGRGRGGRRTVKVDPFEEDYRSLLEEYTKRGEDINLLTVFSKQAFIIKGKLFIAGEYVQIETRVSASLPATIQFVTPKRVGFMFQDGGLLVVNAEDLEDERVRINKAVN